MTTAFWIADGADYVREAERSAASFKRHNPAISTALFGSHSSDRFDRTYPLTPRQSDHWYLDSTRYFVEAVKMLRESYLLYFDTDTYTLAPLDDLVALIGRFAIVGAHAPARQTAPTVDPVPDAFPELNVGVLGIDNQPATQAALEEWLARYQQHADVYGNNDQAPLREALWCSNVTVYAMPPEYNCRFGFGGFAALPVKVLHARGADFEKAARIVNARAGMRVWSGSDFA